MVANFTTIRWDYCTDAFLSGIILHSSTGALLIKTVTKIIVNNKSSTFASGRIHVNQPFERVTLFRSRFSNFLSALRGNIFNCWSLAGISGVS